MHVHVIPNELYEQGANQTHIYIYIYDNKNKILISSLHKKKPNINFEQIDESEYTNNINTFQ